MSSLRNIHTQKWETYTQKRVGQALQKMVDTGVLIPGEALPPERELALQLNISRPTLRTVLKRLEEWGVMQSDPRRGRVLKRLEQEKSGSSLLANSIVFISDLDISQVTSQKHEDGYSRSIAVGVIGAIQSAGHEVMTLSNAHAENRITEILMHQPMGIVHFKQHHLSLRDIALVTRIVSRGVPVVTYHHPPADESVNFDTVASDHRQGAYELTRWFIAQGHQNILRVTLVDQENNDVPIWFKERQAGFDQAMIEAGLPIKPMLHIPMPIKEPQTQQDADVCSRVVAGYMVEVLQGDDVPDAIMAVSDNPGLCIARALQHCGVDPVRDIPVVGYDYQWPFSPVCPFYNTTPVASVDKHNIAIGREMVQLLMDRCSGTITGPAVHRLVPPRLMITPQSDLIHSSQNNLS